MLLIIVGNVKIITAFLNYTIIIQKIHEERKRWRKTN